MASAVEESRKKLGLSQEELATSVGISRQYYNAIVNYRRTPSVDVAKLLGKILGLEWTIFFEDSVNKQATSRR